MLSLMCPFGFVGFWNGHLATNFAARETPLDGGHVTLISENIAPTSSRRARSPRSIVIATSRVLRNRFCFSTSIISLSLIAVDTVRSIITVRYDADQLMYQLSRLPNEYYTPFQRALAALSMSTSLRIF